MAKKIKFNMKFGDTSIRTVEDLQNEFSAQDVMEHYQNGILLKFLECRGYNEYAKKVKALSNEKKAPDAVFKELVGIFEIEMDNAKENEYSEMLRLQSESRAAYESYAKGKAKETEVVDNYLKNYDALIERLIDYKDDLGKIIAYTEELYSKYKKILRMNFYDLYFRLSDKEAYYPIFYMLAKYLFFRERWHIESSRDSDSIMYYDDSFIENKNIIEDLRKMINRVINLDNFTWLKKSKNSSGHFEQIESKGKRYLILQAPPESKVHSPGDPQNGFTTKDIYYKIVVINGIEYRCDREEYLYYVEVGDCKGGNEHEV